MRGAVCGFAIEFSRDKRPNKYICLLLPNTHERGVAFMGRGTHSATARILNGKEFDRYIIKRKCKTFTKKTKSTASHRERERDAKRRARLRVVLVRGWCLLCCVLCDFLESRPAECPVFCACACCSARPPLSSPYSPSSVGAFCAGASTRC